MLDGFKSFMEAGPDTAHFTVYQNNTALVLFPLQAEPFTAAVSDSLVAGRGRFSVASAPTDVAGRANRYTITTQLGIIAKSGTISAVGGGGEIQTPSVTVTLSEIQTLNALVLRMASDGRITIEASLTLV